MWDMVIAEAEFMFSGEFCFWHPVPERSWLSNKYSVAISYGSHLYTHGELSLLTTVRRSKTKSRTWSLHVPRTTKQEHVNSVGLFPDKGSQLEVGLLGEEISDLFLFPTAVGKWTFSTTGDDWKHLLLSGSGWLGTVHSKIVFRQYFPKPCCFSGGSQKKVQMFKMYLFVLLREKWICRDPRKGHWATLSENAAPVLSWYSADSHKWMAFNFLTHLGS